MKTITLSNGQTIEAVEVYGGKDHYQGAYREYLEVVVPQEGHTVEGLEAAMSGDACETLVITEPTVALEGEETGGAQYIHEGYVIRGGSRVWREEESGVWYIGIKRYQRTELERTVAQLQAAVAAMQGQ